MRHSLEYWLRRYVMSRKVVGSRPNEVTDFINFPNRSGSTRPWDSLSHWMKWIPERQIYNVSGENSADGMWGWQPYRHLWADCLDTVGSSTTQNPQASTISYAGSSPVYILMCPYYFLRTFLLLVTVSVVPSAPVLVTLMMEAICSSETSVLTRAKRRNIPEDGILHSHLRKNLKSYLLQCIS
jgi:hypothetical protein